MKDPALRVVQGHLREAKYVRKEKILPDGTSIWLWYMERPDGKLVLVDQKVSN